MTRLRLLATGLVFGFLIAGPAWAQEVKVAVQEGPLYVGEPVLVRVTAEDFEEKPQPTCDPGTLPQGLSVRAVGVRPSISSFTQVINGQLTSYRKVIYAYDFHVTAEKPGGYRIPPFTVKQDQTAKVTQALSLRFQEISTDKDMRVSMILTQRAVYPGQQVPVTIEWWYGGDLNDVRDLTFRSPIFDQFTFTSEPVGAQDTFLPVTTQKGVLRLKARREKRKLNGREFLVVASTPLLVVNQPGEYNLGALTVTMNKVTRWGRDVFGRRQPAAWARQRAVHNAGKLVIRELPIAQAPPAFAGAIGRGFTLKVGADRTVVRVGDPITLKIVLRGEGNLAMAALPRLSVWGLDSKRFRWPGGEVGGTLSGESKSFTVTLRVLDESVAEIPGLSYSWFDPELGQFQTTRSSPVALRVQGAQMVRAEEVVGGAAVNGGQKPGEYPRQPEATGAPTVASPTGYDLTGADLAIETRAAELLVDESRRYGGAPVRFAVYGVSVLLVILAWIRRKMTDADPEVQRRRRATRERVQEVARAAGLPRQEAASQIATAMRAMATQVNGPMAREVEDFLRRCDDLAYAPDTGNAEPIDRELHHHAMELARAMAKGTL